MIDVRENNYLLPLENEEYDANKAWVRGLALNVMISMERAPIFTNLNRSFWLDRFSDMSCKDLKAELKAADLPTSRSAKPLMVATLTSHWSTRISSN